MPRDDESRHNGAGRFIHLRMRPMTLSETGHSANSISFADIMAGKSVACPDPGVTVGDLAQSVAIGGWPGRLGLNANQAQRAMQGYIHDICSVDIRRIDGVRRDPRSVMRLIQSLARNVACPTVS